MSFVSGYGIHLPASCRRQLRFTLPPLSLFPVLFDMGLHGAKRQILNRAPVTLHALWEVTCVRWSGRDADALTLNQNVHKAALLGRRDEYITAVILPACLEGQTVVCVCDCSRGVHTVQGSPILFTSRRDVSLAPSGSKCATQRKRLFKERRV